MNPLLRPIGTDGRDRRWSSQRKSRCTTEERHGQPPKVWANHDRRRSKLHIYALVLNILPTFAREKAVLFAIDHNHVKGQRRNSCCYEGIHAKERESESFTANYGTIAFGTQVMRDGSIRDASSLEFGGALGLFYSTLFQILRTCTSGSHSLDQQLLSTSINGGIHIL